MLLLDENLSSSQSDWYVMASCRAFPFCAAVPYSLHRASVWGSPHEPQAV